MSNLVVSSTEVEGANIFHEHVYENDGSGGNSEQTRFSITNRSGNEIKVIAICSEYDLNTQKYCDREVEIEATSVTLEFNGSAENNELLMVMKAILDAEEIRYIIKS
jgi:hypothetical protein